jgi:hypothetical protein
MVVRVSKKIRVELMPRLKNDCESILLKKELFC